VPESAEVVHFRVLGPVEVVADGRTLGLGGRRQRALLAALLLHANEVVSSERLIELVWGDAPPVTVTTALHGYVSGLRRLLEPGRAADAPPEVLLTRAPGYLLRVENDDVDLHRFERLAREARDALARGEAEPALVLLQDALALWRGTPLDDLPPGPFAEAERQRLEELRLAAAEDRIDAELALGRHAHVVGEITALVARHALRERLRAQLMLALYRSGRQGEALAAYQDARRTLLDELGIEPTPELQRLERAILNQDPALAAPTPTAPPPELRPPAPGVPEPPPRRRRRALAGAALAGVLAAAGSILFFALGRGSDRGSSFTARGNTIVEIDPGANRVVGSIPVGARPDAVVAAAGSLWVANLDDATVSRVDDQAGAVERTIATGRAATGLAATPGGVWFVAAGQDGRARVGLIDARFQQVTRTLDVDDVALARAPAGVASGAGSLWIVPGGVGMLARVDPTTKRAVRIDTRSCCASAVAFGAGAAWIADSYVDTVTRVDPENVARVTIPVGHGPSAIAVDAGGVWVAIEREGVVIRIDPATNAVTDRIRVGRSPTGIALGAGSVWVANSRDGTVSRIDPRTGKPVATIAVGEAPRGIVFSGSKLWVTVQTAPAVSEEARAGGAALLTAQEDVGTLDPALAYTPLSEASFTRARLSWQIEYATCAKLLNYPDHPAPVGSQLVPEVARTLPERSQDGRTYTFTIRRGFRFSAPSNQPVTAATFKYTIERSLSPRMQGPALAGPGGSPSETLGDIVGAGAYMAGRAAHISGVVARGDKLTIELVRPDSTLPARVALPFFCAVPTDTPVDPRGLGTVPSAGPYYVATYVPGQRIVLRRNPGYGGDRQTHLEEIDIAIGVPAAEAVERIEAGRADYALDGVPAAENARLTRRYGAGSPAAKAGRQRYFVNPTLTLYGLVLNTSRPPFSDPALRRAVNYAIDRRTLLELTASFLPAVATDQYLPPGMPGFRDARIYPDRPDRGQARRLMRGRRATAVFYSCTFCFLVTNVVARNLAAIGIDVRVKDFAVAELERRIGTRGEPFDLAITARSADYGDPSTLLEPLFDGRTIRARGNANRSYLDDPGINRRLDAATRLSGPARYLAFAKLDEHLARDVAPLVAVANATRQDFFSSRMGCQIYQPIYGIDLAALCVRS
jgi:YVTN family beta-propeller protein